MASDKKIKLVLRNNSTFEGILHKYDEKTGKIALYDVFTEGVQLSGILYFYKKDLISLQYLNSDETQSKHLIGLDVKKDENLDESHFSNPDEKPSFTSFGEMMNFFKKSAPSPLSNCQAAEEEELTLSKMYIDVDENDNEGNTKDDFEDFYETEEYTIINRLCDKFYEAIAEIFEKSIVGLQLDGVNLGRNGTISLFEIATKSQVYIFDILRIGSRAFSEGLNSILEHHKIMKVIHDSRFTSDMICHKYKTSFNNIFDTQVASALVHRINNDGEWPEYVENLPTCLMNHLNLDADQVHFFKVKERENEEEALWLRRPLSTQLLTAVSVNARYLIELHNVLLEKMLVEFQTGVLIYLHHVDSLGGEVEKSHKNKYRLPAEFKNFNHYMNLYKGKNKKNSARPDSHQISLRKDMTNSEEIIVFKRESSPSNVSNRSSSKQRFVLGSFRKTLTDSSSEFPDKMPDNKVGCNKDEEVKRSNSLLTCPDADIVRDPFNTSLPSSETDNQSQESSPPGRGGQFIEYFQNLSLGSDKVDSGLQLDRVFNSSTPIANKTCSSVLKMDCAKSDDSTPIIKQCAESFYVHEECSLSPIKSPKQSVSTFELEVESQKNTVESVSFESPKNFIDIVDVESPKNTVDMVALECKKTVDIVRTIPAGLRDQNLNQRKKKKSPYGIEKSTRKDDDELDTSHLTTDATEEEYGCIPMQHSLQRSDIVVLGSRDLDLRNADVEVGQIEDDVEEGVPKILSPEAEEKIEKIIKLIASKNIQSKLLPCKLKL